MNISSKSKHIDHLERILDSVQDIILVYTPDHVVEFMNQKGYDFYGNTPEETIGNKCYDVYGRSKLCQECPVDITIKSKEITVMQRHIEAYDKILDCYCNPVLNEDGSVKFIIVQMRDVTITHQLKETLEESEKRNRQVMEKFPDPMMVIQDGKIVFGNLKAQQYFKTLIGKDIKSIVPEFVETLEKRMNQIMELKLETTTFDYKARVDDGQILDVEVTSNYINYNGKPAILSIARDVTEKKKSLKDASRLTKRILPKTFPMSKKARIKTIYKPAKTVSGDFYLLEKVNDDFVVGLIGDVSGKGITAAMNISAFNVLFKEAVQASTDPHEIVEILNMKSIEYFDERYTAVCCFTLDYKKQEARMVSAGINVFTHINSKKEWEDHVVKGPFLGMFENSVFDEKRMSFKQGDQLLFYSDGLESIMGSESFREKHQRLGVLDDMVNDLTGILKEKSTDIKGLMDDCTLLALEIM